jgi:hypothetical protein
MQKRLSLLLATCTTAEQTHWRARENGEAENSIFFTSCPLLDGSNKHHHSFRNIFFFCLWLCYCPQAGVGNTKPSTTRVGPHLLL